MALVTIFGNQGEHDTFTISEGQMFFVPSGYLHHIENLNPANESLPAEFIIAFSHELPEDFGFSSAFSAMYNTLKFIRYNEMFYLFVGQMLYLVILFNYLVTHGKIL